MLSKWATILYEATMDAEIEIKNQLIKNIDKHFPLKGLKIKFDRQIIGFGSYRPDFVANVSYENWRFKLVGEIVSSKSVSVFKKYLMYLNALANQKEEHVPIIVSQYISPDKRKMCRDNGIFYLDLSGNVYLSYKGIYIEREGFPNLFPEVRKSRNPFSDKASLILRLLFSDIKRQWGIREISRLVDLDPGYVSRMAKELENRDYISKKGSKIRLNNPKGILEDWVHEYNYKKNRECRYFLLAKGPEEILKKLHKVIFRDDIKYAFGLQAGGNLVSKYSVYNEVHIYVPSQDVIDIFKSEYNLQKAEQGANVIFLMPYYKNSVFYNKQQINDLWVVSDIQLYLDLYNYPIRGLEQAEHIYKKRLQNIIEN